jgi:hypothetical protein
MSRKATFSVDSLADRFAWHQQSSDAVPVSMAANIAANPTVRSQLGQNILLLISTREVLVDHSTRGSLDQ